MKKKNNKKKKIKRKGFTLVELLAVIVIMGILMMVAIPSVTRTIENSRKDTFVDIAKAYGNAARTLWTSDNLTCEGTVSSAVDDGDYYILINSKEGAKDSLPVLLDQGGKSSWGNRDVNGYVRVNISTTPGEDTNGDGIFEVEPKRITKFYVALSDGTHGLIDDDTLTMDELKRGNVNMTLSEEDLKKVELTVDDGRLDCAIDDNGKYSCTGVTPITDITGICVDDNTAVGVTGRVEVDNTLLVNQIKNNNPLITTPPTLTEPSSNTSDESGLYSSTDTNSGQPTYYFRGNVNNNYVSFAGLLWKIIRINEDGTIRLILNTNNTKAVFNSSTSPFDKTYYSNGSNAKRTMDNWYTTNITNKGYESYVSSGTFCEQAKTKYGIEYTSGSATMDEYNYYTPNFKCATDGNGKGIVISQVGLITYDEVIYAGGDVGNYNTSFYLYTEGYEIWTMSPAGFLPQINTARVWTIASSSAVLVSNINQGGRGIDKHRLLPVINLKQNIKATGTGTSTDPYVIITE